MMVQSNGIRICTPIALCHNNIRTLCTMLCTVSSNALSTSYAPIMVCTKDIRIPTMWALPNPVVGQQLSLVVHGYSAYVRGVGWTIRTSGADA